MNFVELFCSTQGRVGRGLYWSCFGAWLVIDILLRASVNVVSAITSNENIIAIPFWTWVLFGVATYLPMTALLVKRLHDTGRSGWWTAFQHLFLCSVFMMFISMARVSFVCVSASEGMKSLRAGISRTSSNVIPSCRIFGCSM